MDDKVKPTFEFEDKLRKLYFENQDIIGEFLGGLVEVIDNKMKWNLSQLRCPEKCSTSEDCRSRQHLDKHLQALKITLGKIKEPKPEKPE